mgnify:CR=1 FL=1
MTCTSNTRTSAGRAPGGLGLLPDAERSVGAGRSTLLVHPGQCQAASHSKILPQAIKELGARTIQVAATDRQNFVTFDVLDEADGTKHRYAVYFEVTKDKRRKKRLLLHVQSAYVPDQLTKRQEKAGKVSFTVLLRKAYRGEKIRG